MCKLLYVFCILSITSICNGIHSENVQMKRYLTERMNLGRSQDFEMKSYLIKPINIRQLQVLLNLRNTENQYFFQGGPMEINKSERVIIPRELNDEFLTRMAQKNLHPSEYFVDQQNNFITKQRLEDEECTKQLGEACLEDDDCCEGACKPVAATSRSCQR